MADNTEDTTGMTEEPDGLEVSPTELMPQIEETAQGEDPFVVPPAPENMSEPADIEAPAQTMVETALSSASSEGNFGQPLPGKNIKIPKKRKVGKTIAICLCTILCFAALVYFAGVVAFSYVAMPNTMLDGTNVSLKTYSEIASQKNLHVTNYATTVTSNDFSLRLQGSSVDLSFDKNAYAENLASQQDSWKWPLLILENHELKDASDVATLNSEKLTTLVSEAVEEYNKKATQPTNAQVVFSQEQDAYIIKQEEVGTALDAEKTSEYLAKALANMPDSIELDDTCLLQPSLSSEDSNLKTAADNANTFLKSSVPLTLGGMDAGTVTKAQISEWIVIDENNTATLDETKLAEWVSENIGKKYDTAGSSRTYKRPDGKTVTVDSTSKFWGNYYGWITDEASLVTKLVEAIKNGSTSTIDIPTKQTAAKVPDEGGKDWGNRYIDCDLSEQYVRMYDDSGNLIWSAPCVTGCTDKDYGTPAGVYVLNSNRATGDVELRGKIDPATNEPEYISHVTYWMPFINNSFAFHDASWRSNFGGSIYVSNGSHGCVNLPSDKAAELWNLCKVGDVVIVHY